MSTIEYHRNMLADAVRKEAFYKALQRVIVKGESALADVGSGTGIIAFMASRLGAKEVYLYEHVDGVARLSQQLAKANKIKNCQIFNCHSTQFTNAPPVDVIVSETLGNYAFEEQIAETIEDAKRFLNPGGIIMPQAIEQYACPVISGRYFNELTVWDRVGYGLDFSRARDIGLNNVYVRTFTAGDLLDGGRASVRWDSADFRKATSGNRKGKCVWRFSQDASIYGLALWWKCTLVPGVEITTSPLAPKTHWEQLYFPVLKPIEAKRGDELTVTLSSTSSYEAGTNFRWQFSLHPASGGLVQTQRLDLEKGFL